MPLPEEGGIVVYRPRAGYDLSAVPRERVTVVQGFYPDHMAFKQAGYQTEIGFEGPAALAVVVVPRSKVEARDLIAQAAKAVGAEGHVVVDGQKTDGVDSLWKELRKRDRVLASHSKAHGRVFWIKGGALDDWRAQDTRTPEGLVTKAGIFSADGADRASQLLVQTLPAKLAARVCDLGAGWGFLSKGILERKGVKSVDLVEAEHAALEAARKNVSDPRATFHWADARQFEAQAFDVVVTNPPFHTGRSADPDLGRAFIASAARLLGPRGELWLVANRHLGYETTLAEAFTSFEEVAGDAAFKVLRATRPAAKARKR